MGASDPASPPNPGNLETSRHENWGDPLRFDEEYRGCRIRYGGRKGWIANIWEPSAYLRLD